MQHRPNIICDTYEQTKVEINTEFILDKIYQFADTQRNFIIAKRKFQKSINIDSIIKSTGFDKSDFTTLYYNALDCGLLPNVTTNDIGDLNLLMIMNPCLRIYTPINSNITSVECISGSHLDLRQSRCFWTVFQTRSFLCFIIAVIV